jgi:hypothetical protein
MEQQDSNGLKKAVIIRIAGLDAGKNWVSDDFDDPLSVSC